MLTNSAGGKAMTGPEVTLETVMQLRAFNESMVPIRKAWGALSMASDGMVVLTSKLQPSEERGDS